jgi:hypothetical protein
MQQTSCQPGNRRNPRLSGREEAAPLTNPVSVLPAAVHL